MPDAQQERVNLGDRSYDIIVGSGLFTRIAELVVPQLASGRVILVSDKTVAWHYAATIENGLRAAGITVDTLTVEPGEGAKSFATLEWLLESMLALVPDRKTTIVALGGGVIGDLAGFAASILLRGVPFIQIPTTLLAQVDSSVGGKTAVNTKAGKNLVGSFYQPKLVIADLDSLATLPPREKRAGYAEIIKYGLIMNADFYRWCLGNAEALLAGDRDLQQEAVLACCRMKADIVGADEREQDKRALLNLGHTFGHALEAETGMSDRLLHGEAVAIGMVMACRLSERMKLIGPETERELAVHFNKLGMPAHLRDVEAEWTVDGISRHFASDKKAEHGKLTFIVLDKLGLAHTAKSVDPALAREVVASFIKEVV